MHLFLLGKKAHATLERLCVKPEYRSKFHIIIATDRNVDNDYSKEISHLCQDYDISYEYRDAKKQHKYSYALAIGWRWLINNPEGSSLFVIHDSLLPKYRGFNPLVTALINGDKLVGATCILANEDFDCGDIFKQKSIEIEYPIKISNVIDIISKLYAELSIELVQGIFSENELSLSKQDNRFASYSLWRDTEDYMINWNEDATIIRRRIDALGSPYAGASTVVDNRLIRILDAEEVNDLSISNRDPGKVIRIEDGRPLVVCGSGILRLNQMLWDDIGENIHPWKKVRVRFG